MKSYAVCVRYSVLYIYVIGFRFLLSSILFRDFDFWAKTVFVNFEQTLNSSRQKLNCSDEL